MYLIKGTKDLKKMWKVCLMWMEVIDDDKFVYDDLKSWSNTVKDLSAISHECKDLAHLDFPMWQLICVVWPHAKSS